MQDAERPSSATSATSRPRLDREPLHEFRVGSISVVPLVQFHYRVDIERFFPDAADWPLDRSAWYWQEPYVAGEQLVIDMGGFLVRAGDRTIIVDAGVGDAKTRPNPEFDSRHDDWTGLLGPLGIAESDIDTVLFTHLHVDHVGNATRRDGDVWVPAFPRAEHFVAAAEIDYWTGPGAQGDLDRLGNYLQDSILPLREAGVLTTTTGDYEVAEGVRVVERPGHTPGNVCIEVESDGARAVFVGDMVHHAVQLAFPEWSTDYCVEYEQAATARRALLSDLGPDDLLFAAHFPGSNPGRVRPTAGGGFRYLAAKPDRTFTGPARA